MQLVITGHRPDKIGGYQMWVLKSLVDFAMNRIRETSPSVVICGMAQGWDMACAIATIKLRDEEKLPIELWGFVPFPGQPSTWRDEKIVEMYKKAVSKANRIINVHAEDPADKHEAVQWLQERNEQMVDYGDKLLALHNGTKGGTYNCIQYALKMGRPIHNVWPEWRKVITTWTNRK